MERLRAKPNLREKREKTKLYNRLIRSALAGIALATILSACVEAKPESPDDGYKTREVLHAVVDPLNGDKYTTLEFRDRLTQEKSQIDFHHLKSNPQKYERLVTNVGGEDKTVLNMQQENVPLGNIEFQNSTITFLDPKTGATDELQIHRVKPVTKEAPKFTAYSLFQGKEKSHLGTIIFSDTQASSDSGKRGEVFVALKPGMFTFDSTSERFANSYMNQVSIIMGELQSKNFNDGRVDQAVWKVEEKDGIRKMNGILKGIPYTIISKNGANETPGYHLNGKKFASTEIFRGNGIKIAQIKTEHYKGTIDGDSVIFKFSVFNDAGEEVVMEAKRYFRNKSESQTSHGVGTTIGFSSSGNLVAGWTDVDFKTPVNFQDENTILSSYGKREADVSLDLERKHKNQVSGILELLGGASILDGLNFQDGELEWSQSTERIIDGAKTATLSKDMGFWLELPVDATAEGQANALALLTSN